MPKQVVSQAQAVRIASRLLSPRLLVHDGDAWPTGTPLPEFYGRPGGFPEGHWVVRRLPREPRTGPSRIVVIAKETGVVHYVGVTADE